MKTFQEFTTEAYGRGSRPVRGRDYDDYKDWKPSLYKSGSHRTQDKTPPTHPAAHLKPKKKSAAERMDAAGKRLGLPEEVEIEEGVRPTPVDKPLDKAAFKKRRKSLKGYEQRGDARKRGHEGKEWYNSGRTYSPDEAKRSRAKMDDEERRTRHRSAVDPDDDNDNNYSADKTKNPKKIRKQKAMGELGEGIGMTMANALGNPPALSKRMKLKQALIINKIKSDAKKNKGKSYSGKAATATTEEYDLSETSLNRVRSKSQKGGMAIMSAQRGDKSKSENKARSKQLEKDIRGAGLPGPTKVSGRYTENPGTPQEKKVGEKSHVVSSGKMGKRKFKKAITKLGKKYNQDSVLIQKKPKGDAQLVGTNKSWPGEGKRVKVGKMNPGKTGEFDTKVKNKTFTYEEYEN